MLSKPKSSVSTSTMWRIASTTSLQLAQRHCSVTSRHNDVTRAFLSSLLVLPWQSSGCRPNERCCKEGILHRSLTSSNYEKYLSSIKKNKRNKKNKQNRAITNSKHIEINGRIVEFGKKMDWRGILDLYKKEKDNSAT